MLHLLNGNILTTTDFTYLLNKPHNINEKQTAALELILQEYPFLQCARALYLKGLHNQDSYRYNYELKKTAAYTNDRTILFELITSPEFKTIQKNQIDIQEEELNKIDVNTLEIVNPLPKSKDTLPNEYIAENDTTLKEKLEIGQPLQFNKTERHSFNEWLQLTKLTPINREETEIPTETPSTLDQKLNLIDKFIENNPKISPIKDTSPTPENINKSVEEPTHLMTETLAKIYLEQKKYTRAIQAYEILILKYPEKSSFFANRIENIKKLQNNN